MDDKTGWNAGLAATFAEYSFDSNQLDDSSAGFKVFGGYRFNKWFGLEGAYYDFGDFDEDLDPPNPGGGATAQIDGLTGSALIYAPLDTTNSMSMARSATTPSISRWCLTTRVARATRRPACCSAPDRASTSAISSPSARKANGSTSTTATSGA